MFEIGSSLREARLRKELSFGDVERATKIRGKYLRSLEDEQFDALPSQSYVKGFLRSYAEYLGLDGQLYVDEYTSRFWIDEEHGSRRARRIRIREQHHRRAERNMIVLTLLAIGAVTALVFAAWNYGRGEGSASPIPNLSPAGTGQKAHARFQGLRIRAVSGPSLLLVRREGPSGAVVFQGTLERGESQRFLGPRFWLNIDRPENVIVTLNGQPASLGVGCPQVVVVTRSQVTSTSTCS